MWATRPLIPPESSPLRDLLFAATLLTLLLFVWLTLLSHIHLDVSLNATCDPPVVPSSCPSTLLNSRAFSVFTRHPKHFQDVCIENAGFMRKICCGQNFVPIHNMDDGIGRAGSCREKRSPRSGENSTPKGWKRRDTENDPVLEIKSHVSSVSRWNSNQSQIPEE